MKIAESFYSPVLYLSCSFLILRSHPEHILQVPRKLQMFGKCSELSWTELSWTELRLQWLKQISIQKVTHAFFVWLSHTYRGGSLTLCATILLYTFHNASVRNQTLIGRLQVLNGVTSPPGNRKSSPCSPTEKPSSFLFGIIINSLFPTSAEPLILLNIILTCA